MKLPSLPTSISEPVPMETSAQSPNTLVATADSSTTSEAAGNDFKLDNMYDTC